ncbi:Rmf/CrpP fold protein [Mangrovactinospora gilvigrisea]|nr:Rmf/CrpP fold protein [Mangrovactinospora gilvigrisea]
MGKGDLAHAFKRGKDAAELGERPEDCPYPVGDPCRAAWLRGYKAGSR